MAVNEQMFDAVMVQKSVGPLRPDPIWLRSPLALPTSVIRRFCTGCGLSAELNAEQATDFATRAEAHFNDGFPKKIYFETSDCGYCSNDPRSPVEVKVIE